MGPLDEYSKPGLSNGETCINIKRKTNVSHMETHIGFNIWEAFHAVPASNFSPVWFYLT